MRRRTILTAAIALLALVAAACGTGESVQVGDPAPEESSAAGGPTQSDGPAQVTDGDGVGGTLVAAISGSPDQLDPHLTSAYPSFQILENVYDTLVQPDEELQMVPALAESWETSDDQLTWTFALRDGVEFHNGRELIADDVVFSMERIRDEGANAFRLDAVDTVTAPDDATVVFTLTRPAPNFLANVGAFKGMAIVPQEIVEDGTIGSDAVGTGPFRLVDYSDGQGATLEANPDYWGEGPFIDELEFRFISEPTVALTALRNGEVTWTDNVPPQGITDLANDDELIVESTPSNDYWYFAANQNRPPFDNRDVRRALAYAIDREEITQGAKFDAATVNQTAIPADSFFASDYAPYQQDPDMARQLLADAGVTDLTVDLMVTDEFPETVTAAQVIAAQLGDVGINVEIRTLDFATWLAEQEQGNFDVFLLGWLGNIDPDDFYYAQHHSTGNFNFQGYNNPEVDMLLDAARQEADADTRKGLYDDAVKLIVDDASYVYLYNPDVVHAWSPQLLDYTPRADRAIRFEGVRLGG